MCIKRIWNIKKNIISFLSIGSIINLNIDKSTNYYIYKIKKEEDDKLVEEERSLDDAKKVSLLEKIKERNNGKN